MLGKGKAHELQDLERELILSSKQGSVSAFEQLIIKVDKKMLSVAAGLTSSPEEAEDVYQEAMINAFNGLAKFRFDSQFNTWLYRIVVNTAFSYRRKLKSKLWRLFSDESSVDENSPESMISEQHDIQQDPERQMVNQQLSQAIHQAMKKLSDKERTALVLCHQQELTISDAAQIMSTSQGAVKSYLFRARNKMRHQLSAFSR